MLAVRATPAPGMDGARRRRARRGLAAAGLVAAGVVVARAARRRAEQTTSGAERQDATPWALELPQAESLVVPTADGVDLAVTVAGPADGPAVVLSHCWTGSRAVWAGVAHRLAAGGHRVVLYDQRGHGRSSTPDAEPTIGHLADDLRAVLEATDVTDAVLVGHSMGGMSIQSYALEHPDHFAERARGVVLVATAARVLGRRAVPPAVVQRVLGDGRQEWTRRGTVGRAMVRGSLGQGALPEHVELTRAGFADTSGTARAGFLVAMASMDLRPALPTMAVPATVLVGTRDTLTPLPLGRQLADELPDAELVVLPGAGHMLPLEAPDRIVDAVHATARRAATVPVAP